MTMNLIKTAMTKVLIMVVVAVRPLPKEVAKFTLSKFNQRFFGVFPLEYFVGVTHHHDDY